MTDGQRHDVYRRRPDGLWVGKDTTAAPRPPAPRPPARTEVVRATCPECRNLNRRARRACRTCGGSGLVTKRVPTVEAEAHGMFEHELRRAQREADADGLG